MEDILDDFQRKHLAHWAERAFPPDEIEDKIKTIRGYLSNLDKVDREYILNNWGWWQVYDEAVALIEIKL